MALFVDGAVVTWSKIVPIDLQSVEKKTYSREKFVCAKRPLKQKLGQREGS